MREVQKSRRRVREEVLLRVHLELLRHPLVVVPVRDLPLACCKSRDLMLPVLVFQVSCNARSYLDSYMLLVHVRLPCRLWRIHFSTPNDPDDARTPDV